MGKSNAENKTDAVNEIITRSVVQIIPTRSALKKALLSGKRLTFYVGIDPTADYVHLGHSTNFLILERLHKLGHCIIVLVGDFTAMIGDPSDKTAMRVQLTREQVQHNLKGFKAQIGKILDFKTKKNPIEFKFNSKWLSKLTFKDSIELASNFTIQQMLERDAFKKRLEQNKPLFVHETFYPLMQGYDSVAMGVDAEIGGTDQTFNMLAGRTLLKRYKNKEKFVITTTLLENPVTGEKLMSKSLGTGIALNEPPKDMFVKVMQLPDESLIQCFTDCTRLSLKEIEGFKKSLAKGENPRDIKLILAYEIVKMYHGSVLADKAKQSWIAEVSNKALPSDLPTFKISQKDDLVSKIAELSVVGSKTKAKRLILDGAVKIDGRKASFEESGKSIKDGSVLTIGKKHAFKIRITK